MKSTLKNRRLGEFIHQVDLRNKNLEVQTLLGVSNEKYFIPSIANIVGTDLSSYKIVKYNQFAYGTVTSRNGDKISIALLKEKECIVSSSYVVFEINDTNELNPDYLMMWFKRPEFDRYSRYMSHGSVRELFGWEKLCEVELPIPTIEEQLKIVEDYKVIEERIAIKEAINNNLFEMINYSIKSSKSMFDDFAEYKITEIFDIKYGRFEFDKINSGAYPVYGAGGIIGSKDNFEYDDIKLIMGCRGSCGKVTLTHKFSCITANSLIFNLVDEKFDLFYLYAILSNYNTREFVTGSVQEQITVSTLESKNISLSLKQCEHLKPLLHLLIDSIHTNEDEIIQLLSFRNILLKSLSKQ